MRIKCLKTGEVFNSLKSASEKHGVRENNLSEMLSGKRNNKTSLVKMDDERYMFT